MLVNLDVRGNLRSQQNNFQYRMYVVHTLHTSDIENFRHYEGILSLIVFILVASHLLSVDK